ncbi:MAG: hypothetical protein ACT4QD_09565 [Acidobacteriota bacterium]
MTCLAQALTRASGLVVLKVYRACEEADAILARYQRWKPALSRIEHPAVGTLLDVGLTGDGHIYAASAYVAGRPLTPATVRSSVPLLLRRPIVKQLGDAVDAAHAAGVVHLGLTASKVKLATTTVPHATILGFGSRVIIDGEEGSPDEDRRALAHLVREVGLEG